MAFKLRSGNKSPFKNIGSSPVKDMKTGKYEHSFESPVKQKVDPDAPGTPGKPGYEPPVKREDLDDKGKAIYDKHRAKKEYWYKINGKEATKTQYIAYKNKPGGDEPGKQTNDPNVSLARQSGNKRK